MIISPAIIQIFDLLGNVSLIIIAPVMVFNFIKLIKIEQKFIAHVELDDVKHEGFKRDLQAHSDEIKILRGV